MRDYLEDLKVKGATDSTLVTTRYRLIGILRLVEGDRGLSSVTEKVARGLYLRRCDEVSADTNRGELGCAQRLGDWIVKRGWTKTNPWDGMEVVGKRRRGKPQLRVDEARRFLKVVLADASPEATAVAMALIMGVRAGEVVDRVVRDLDDGGKLLWIPKSKTQAGVRQLEIPVVLRDRLAELTIGKGPEDRLFTLTRHALHYHVVRFCKLAGVPRVTPHGLRGVHATVATAAGATAALVAGSLGHGGVTVTRRHYIAPGTEEQVTANRVVDLLGTNEPETIPSGDHPEMN